MGCELESGSSLEIQQQISQIWEIVFSLNLSVNVSNMVIPDSTFTYKSVLYTHRNVWVVMLATDFIAQKESGSSQHVQIAETE